MAEDVIFRLVKRSRRRKPESELRTKYYYRIGRLELVAVDNSSIGIHTVTGRYVFIKRYDKNRGAFLVFTDTGRLFWTTQLIHLCPRVDGFELYHTSFPLLIVRNLRHGDYVCYRTRNGFAYLKMDRAIKHEEYQMFRNGQFNLNIPKSYNFCLGYSDICNESESKDRNLIENLYNIYVKDSLEAEDDY